MSLISFAAVVNVLPSSTLLATIAFVCSAFMKMWPNSSLRKSSNVFFTLASISSKPSPVRISSTDMTTCGARRAPRCLLSPDALEGPVSVGGRLQESGVESIIGWAFCFALDFALLLAAAPLLEEPRP
eukprot:5018369-Pyramimonas_sp.AAC.1